MILLTAHLFVMLKVYYKVQLLSHNGKHCNHTPEVLMTSEVYDNLHDCREFVHWFSCQVSTPFYYRFLEFTEDGDFKYVHHYPIMTKSPTICSYFPPTPLYLSIKKHRRHYRHSHGLYYEY